MSPQNPRDMRDYLRILERQSVQLRGIPALIQNTVGVIVDEDKKDKVRKPAAPIELVPQTAFYIDPNSRRRVRFLLDFPDVVYNTDGTTAAIQQYELWGREETVSALDTTTSSVPSQAAPGLTLPGLTSTKTNKQIAAEAKPWTMQSTNVQSFFRADGYIPGSVWRFRARALGVATIQPGEWSEEVVVQMLADTLPPPQPTAPTVSAARGQLTVSWDGQTVSGAMPPDFKYAILAHGTESSPTLEIARFGRGGGFTVVTGMDYYDPQFFRVRAVDESGNAGPWSEQAVGYTTPLVDRDVILSTIDAAKTHLKNIDAGVSILPNTIITEHLVVTEEMTAAIANFLVVNADQINVNSLAADEVFTGLLDAVLVVSDMFKGKTFHGGIFTTTEGGRFQTNVEEYRGLKIDATGMLGYSTGGVETFKYEAATGNVSIAGGTYTGGKFQTQADNNRGLKIDSAGMRGYTSAGVETLDYDAATGNVTITGGSFTGGSFQTSSFANIGVKLDSTGLKVWNSATGQLAVDAGPMGSRFTGTVTSGFGKAKAILSDEIFEGQPGLRFETGVGYQHQPFIISQDVTGQSIGGTLRDFSGALYLSSGWPNGQPNPGRMLLDSDGSWVLTGAYGQVSSNRLTNTTMLRNASGTTIDLTADNAAVIARAGNNLNLTNNNATLSHHRGTNLNLTEETAGITTRGGSFLSLTGDSAGLATSSNSSALSLSSSRATLSRGSTMMDMNGSDSTMQSGSRYIRISGTAALMLYSSSQYVQTNGSGTTIAGGLTVGGSKNFVMPHPTKEGMELLHGATESPVSGIEYWGEGTVGPMGEDVVELPEYFEALAKPEGRVALVTGRGEVMDWSDVIDGKVTVYGAPGAQYSWLVKAERFGGDFEVEREALKPPTEVAEATIEALVPPDTAPLVDSLAGNDDKGSNMDEAPLL